MDKWKRALAAEQAQGDPVQDIAGTAQEYDPVAFKAGLRRAVEIARAHRSQPGDKLTKWRIAAAIEAEIEGS